MCQWLSHEGKENKSLKCAIMQSIIQKHVIETYDANDILHIIFFNGLVKVGQYLNDYFLMTTWSGYENCTSGWCSVHPFFPTPSIHPSILYTR